MDMLALISQAEEIRFLADRVMKEVGVVAKKGTKAAAVRARVALNDMRKQALTLRCDLNTIANPDSGDPVEKLLDSARVDDTPLSPEESAAIAEGEKDIAEGNVSETTE